ncbi:hypothetical protein Salat_1895200 [Sesamum alatum]|uniref:Uncharacterized protein n=1 Tax=Sesamum alatum TaxID=300844 RepID=A0AAE2CI72_9LAMI|nr:hypothetical protein Salat_1895200 [Sesamum alatum]
MKNRPTAATGTKRKAGDKNWPSSGGERGKTRLQTHTNPTKSDRTEERNLRQRAGRKAWAASWTPVGEKVRTEAEKQTSKQTLNSPAAGAESRPETRAEKQAKLGQNQQNTSTKRLPPVAKEDGGTEHRPAAAGRNNGQQADRVMAGR